MNSERINLLDVLRFVSACCILLFHFAFRGYYHFTDYHHEELGHIFKYGYLGVDAFFIISGFVIALSIQHRTSFQFAVSRAIRLYPSFWIACLVTYVCVLFWGRDNMIVSETDFYFNLTMVPNLFGAKYVCGVYWTLLEEIHFYFLVAIFLVFFKYQKYEWFLLIWALLCWTNYFLEEKYLELFFRTLWGPYFVLGSVYYFSYKSGWNWQRVMTALSMIVLVLFLSKIRMTEVSLNYKTDYNFTVVICIMLVVNLILLLLSLGYLTLKTNKLFILGAITYPLYLIHEFIGYILFNKLETVDPTLELFIVIVISLLLSLIIYYAEKPVSNCLKSIFKKV